MISKTIKVSLTDEEYNFIKWLAKYDDVTISKELDYIFHTELNELMELFESEYERGKL